MKMRYVAARMFLLFTRALKIKPGKDAIYSFDPISYNEWALVKKDGLYGFIDSTGKEVVSPQYEKSNTF